MVEAEPRSEQIRLLVTPTMLQRIEDARGEQNRSDWLRDQIEKGLSDGP